MKTSDEVRKYFSELGRRGGKAKSKKKSDTAKANGQKGGHASLFKKKRGKK